MRKRTRLGLANLLTIFLLLVNIMSPLNPIYAEDLTGTDKTSVLTDFSAVIKQNGAVINEGDTFISTDPISIEISFSVPVSGDYPTPANPVNKGDTASFQLSDAFNLISGSTIALNMGSINVAHVTFATDPITKMVTANVVFDGADEVFDGTSDTVTCQFSANFEYDATAAPVTGGDYLVTILEKTFTVTVPPQEIIYDVTKFSKINIKYIF
ncbi:hypothetical protein SDC9_137353 [bioreactor metagenome]|uniref:Uncharacterized protein n=1 Tax=bioreactor metagenome TaxID=1076179 RepID=A0A645DNX4_9ZZZZ